MISGNLQSENASAQSLSHSPCAGGSHSTARIPQALAVVSRQNAVAAPVSGKLVATAELSDPLFAKELLGPTLGIVPSIGKTTPCVAYAPISGTVLSAMPHAVALRREDGLEVLVHIGIDTVNLKGRGFALWVEKGARVCVGEPLVSFDSALIRDEGYADVVLTILSNAAGYNAHLYAAEKHVPANSLEPLSSQSALINSELKLSSQKTISIVAGDVLFELF